QHPGRRARAAGARASRAPGAGRHAHPLGPAARARAGGAGRLPGDRARPRRQPRRGRVDGAAPARAMTERRLFVAPAELEGAAVVVSGEAHRYLARVLRARPGQRVTLFDGAGTEVEAEVVRVASRETELALGARRARPALAAPVAITLLVAIPRGERM